VFILAGAAEGEVAWEFEASLLLLLLLLLLLWNGGMVGWIVCWYNVGEGSVRIVAQE
jgi:hypothetical protein